METTQRLLMLAGSGLGTILALAICRLFDGIRARIPEPVAMVGFVIAVLSVFFALCFPLLFGPLIFIFLVLGGVVWCQKFHPAKTSPASAALFGILVIELLLTGAVLGLTNHFLSRLIICPLTRPHRIAEEAFLVNLEVTLPLVLLLEEAIGPLRRRIRL